MAVKDLSKRAGLPIGADPQTGRLEFPADLFAGQPEARTRADLSAVLQKAGGPGPDPVYVTYRDVGHPGDRELLAAAGIVYNLTVLPPGKVGREYAKTHGGYPPAGRPAVVEVLAGTAFVLCQKPAADSFGDVDDVVLLELEPGQKAVIPPGYGYVLINPEGKALVAAELAARAPGPALAPYRERQGACYYCVAGDGNEPEFEENTRYDSVEDLRMAPAEELPHLGLEDGVPLYVAAATDPARFAWLVDPAPVAGDLLFPELDESDEDDDEE